MQNFFDIVGTNTSIYRRCGECERLYIADVERADVPYILCDPEPDEDGDACLRHVPFCACKCEMLDNMAEIRTCDFPNCENGGDNDGEE